MVEDSKFAEDFTRANMYGLGTTLRIIIDIL